MKSREPRRFWDRVIDTVAAGRVVFSTDFVVGIGHNASDISRVERGLLRELLPVALVLVTAHFPGLLRKAEKAPR